VIIRNLILFAWAAVGVLLMSPAFGQKPGQESKSQSEAPKSAAPASDKGSSEKPAKPSGISTLHIEITAGEKDEPVENASVYVRFPEARTLGREKIAEMNVKTNREGQVKVTNVPRGKTMIQVIAQGWKTYGRWLDVDQAEQTIKIKLEPRHRWY
jgi:hypothetical protein